MKLIHTFVDRPILAGVISILIVLVGGVAFFNLPITQYPEIAPPSITVTAYYPGATAEIAADTVASVLEQQINGVEHMLYMKSENTANGQTSLTVTFKPGTDLDTAQVLVQNRVSLAEPLLPLEVQRLGVDVRKNSPDLMMVIHILSPDGSRDSLYVSNYARTQVVDRLARIEGVGEARFFEFGHSRRIHKATGIVAGDGGVESQREQHVIGFAGDFRELGEGGDVASKVFPAATGRVTARLVVLEREEAGGIAKRSDGATLEIEFTGAVAFAFDDELAPEVERRWSFDHQLGEAAL